ncbi:MAG TPA: conserved virulence factor C family protein [Pseudogracilibacillus sp.]|nr:conserved virulence factor C family protein [Pseudogracilibacillus sp.]
MKIISMEPTPSPYSLKVNVNESLADGEALNFTEYDDLTNAPQYIQDLLKIEGVKGLYRVIDFITIERNPRVEWEAILPKVREVIGSDEETEDLFSKAVTTSDEEAFGEVKVEIQMIRHIPTQVKLTEGDTEKRFALPNRLMDAAMEAATASNSYLLERQWVEQSPRYGEVDEIGEAVVAELDAAFTEERLETLLKAAVNDEAVEQTKFQQKVTIDMLDSDDWRARYAVLANMADPTEDDYALLNKALDDDNSSVRRIATAYLGMIEQKETLPYLYKALQDKSVNVRRTAGDCLSDLGFTEAIPQMIETLDDKSRIVRWRAAMFLYEVGDESAVPALEKALQDPEFEVRMQAKMALARIESGKAGEGSIWQQMEEATRKK